MYLYSLSVRWPRPRHADPAKRALGGGAPILKYALKNTSCVIHEMRFAGNEFPQSYKIYAHIVYFIIFFLMRGRTGRHYMVYVMHRKNKTGISLCSAHPVRGKCGAIPAAYFSEYQLSL